MKRYVTCICLMSLFLLALISCQADKKREVENKSERSEVRRGVKALPSGEIRYTVPEGWRKQQPSSSMRKGQFSLSGVGGAGAAELVVFSFPGGGGTVDANLKRWYAQFKQTDGSATEDHVELKN